MPVGIEPRLLARETTYCVNFQVGVLGSLSTMIAE
jgi:hypothetical protein